MVHHEIRIRAAVIGQTLDEVEPRATNSHRETGRTEILQVDRRHQPHPLLSCEHSVPALVIWHQKHDTSSRLENSTGVSQEFKWLDRVFQHRVARHQVKSRIGQIREGPDAWNVMLLLHVFTVRLGEVETLQVREALIGEHSQEDSC